MPDIKQQIKDKSVKGIYLLYGEEDFMKDFYADKITELCTQEGPKEFNCMKLNTEKPDNDAITEFVVSMPFMSDTKILVLKNSGIFSKSNDATKKFWTDIFDTLPDYMVIVFCETNVDKRSALFKAVSKNHTAEEFGLAKESDLINWFARILLQSGKSMTKEDICFIIENVGRNMYLLKNEADKLIAFTSGKEELISREDIEACICKSLEGKVFDLIDNITAGRKSKVIEGIRDLKTLREQPVMIIALIFRQFSILRKTKVFENEPTSVIAQKTKVPDFVVRKNLSQLKRFTLDELENAIYMCNEADENIKTGLCEPWLALEKLAVSLMNN